jgi:hypothetical protein
MSYVPRTCDPDANLKRQRWLTGKIFNTDRRIDTPATEEHMRELAQLVIDLDEHISGGGALPLKWGQRPPIDPLKIDSSFLESTFRDG